MTEQTGGSLEEWVGSTNEYALSQADSGDFAGAITTWQSILAAAQLEEESAKEVHWNIGLMMLAQGDESGAGKYLSEHGWPQDAFSSLGA